MEDRDPNVPKTEQGLIRMYNIERLDGKPVGEGVFLEFSDPHSWKALDAWADDMYKAGYWKLATQIRERVQAERDSQLMHSLSKEIGEINRG